MKRKMKRLMKEWRKKTSAYRAKAAAYAGKIKAPARVVLTTVLAAYVLAQFPQLHRDYIRFSVASKTYYMSNEAGNHGGTGVHVKAASGKTYLITNAHVCEVGENGIIWVSDGTRRMPKRIIESSPVTDLCLVEPVEGVSGLSLGSAPRVGQLVHAIGHPRLQPTTMTTGEVVAQQEVMVMDFMIANDEDRAKCSKPKQKIFKAQSFFGEVEVCVVDIQAYSTTINIIGGSSGSPMVDWKGDLVGLMFAGDEELHWGMAVVYSDIKTFLSAY